MSRSRAVVTCLAAILFGCTPARVASPPAAPPPADSTFASLPPFSPSTVIQASATTPADGDSTLAYWKKLKELLERKAGSRGDKETIAAVRKMVADVRAVPAVGVDPELIEYAEAYARYTDRFITLVDVLQDNPRLARRHPHPEQVVLESGRQALDVASQLVGLRARLSNRYGVEFPPIQGPG